MSWEYWEEYYYFICPNCGESVSIVRLDGMDDWNRTSTDYNYEKCSCGFDFKKEMESYFINIAVENKQYHYGSVSEKYKQAHFCKYKNIKIKPMSENIIRSENETWIFYNRKDIQDKRNKTDISNLGKWMYFFEYSDIELKRCERLCEKALSKGVTNSLKISKKNALYPKGVLILRCDNEDNETHKKIIKFMIENNLIPKTRNGRYYNISFKTNEQTIYKEYGNVFKPILKLENFIDLNNGKFII